MPKREFKLSKDDPRVVLLQWKGIWKNIQVSFDGQSVGTIPDQKALKAGQEFALPTGDTLGVKLKTGLQTELQVTRNGKPLPGSGGDPRTQLKLAQGIIWFIGGLTAVAGLIAELGDVVFLKNLGMGWITVGVGAIFGVLGYFVGKRSTVALGIAVALLIVDTVLTVALSAGGGQVPTAGIVVRVFFLISIFQGFGAIKKLKALDALEKQVDAF